MSAPNGFQIVRNLVYSCLLVIRLFFIYVYIFFTFTGKVRCITCIDLLFTGSSWTEISARSSWETGEVLSGMKFSWELCVLVTDWVGQIIVTWAGRFVSKRGSAMVCSSMLTLYLSGTGCYLITGLGVAVEEISKASTWEAISFQF